MPPLIDQCLGDSFDLFMCFKEPVPCILTWCCPCNTAGVLGKSAGKNCILWCIFSLIPLLSCWARGTVRSSKFNSKPLWENFLLVCCCGGCALCQEARKGGLGTKKLLDIGGNMK